MGKGGILGQLVTWVAINEVRAVHAVQERDEEARPLTAAEENRRREAAGEWAKKIFGLWPPCARCSRSTSGSRPPPWKTSM
jgi:hypothetical protein